MPTARARTGSASARRPAAVLALLLAAGTTALMTPLAGASEEGPVCRSAAHPEVAERLGARIRQEADRRDGVVAAGVSAHDGDLTCALRPRTAFDAASVGKVVVLGALLRTAMDEGRELTAREKDLATDMITVSGNDSAVELRDRLGPERLQRFLDLAEMDRTRLHPEGYVGLMRTDVTDQLDLLRVLRTDDDVLGPDQRAYARGLLGDVVAEQRWGMPAGAPAGAEVHLKNGWLPHDGTDVWRVNSIGGFRGTPIGDYDLVVLTDDNAGMRYGVDTVEAVAAGAHEVLTGGEPRGRTPWAAWARAVTDGTDRP